MVKRHKESNSFFRVPDDRGMFFNMRNGDHAKQNGCQNSDPVTATKTYTM